METINKFKKAALAVAVAASFVGVSSSANASALSFTPSGGVDVAAFSNSGIQGAFTDDWTFSLSGAPSFNLGAQVQPFNYIVPNPFGQAATVSLLTNLDMKLLDSGNNVISQGTAIPTTNLLGGSYSLQVSGNGSGLAGGIYSGVAWVQPVPELSTWAMMAVGVGLVGMALRRRSRAEQDVKLAGTAVA